MPVCFKKNVRILFELRKQKSTYADVDSVYEHKEEATQVLAGGGQAVSRGSCLPLVLSRGFHAVARGTVLLASQVLDRGTEAVACGA